MKKVMLALAASLLCFAAQPAMAAPTCDKDCNKCATECKTSLTYAKKKGAKYAAAVKSRQPSKIFYTPIDETSQAQATLLKMQYFRFATIKIDIITDT